MENKNAYFIPVIKDNNLFSQVFPGIGRRKST